MHNFGKIIFSLITKQIIYREKKAIFESEVLMVNVNSKGKPLKIPEPLVSALND